MQVMENLKEPILLRTGNNPPQQRKIIKKICADVKNTAAKQSSLTSFFKKS